MLTHRSPPHPKCKKYFFIFYISTFIRLPHLYQGNHDHRGVTAKDGVMGRVRSGSLMLGFRWENRGWVPYFFIFCSFFLLLVIFLSSIGAWYLFCISLFLNSFISVWTL